MSTQVISLKKHGQYLLQPLKAKDILNLILINRHTTMSIGLSANLALRRCTAEVAS